jgi:hypothetical protein
VVDSLGRRQLEGSVSLVDLLQIRLQESSCYAATEHCCGCESLTGVDEIMFILTVVCGRHTRPGRHSLCVRGLFSLPSRNLSST